MASIVLLKMEEEKKEMADKVGSAGLTSALVSRVQKFAEVVAEAINTHVLYIQAERKRARDAIRAQRVITPGCCVVEFVILKNKTKEQSTPFPREVTALLWKN